MPRAFRLKLIEKRSMFAFFSHLFSRFRRVSSVFFMPKLIRPACFSHTGKDFSTPKFAPAASEAVSRHQRSYLLALQHMVFDDQKRSKCIEMHGTPPQKHPKTLRTRHLCDARCHGKRYHHDTCARSPLATDLRPWHIDKGLEKHPKGMDSQLPWHFREGNYWKLASNCSPDLQGTHD